MLLPVGHSQTHHNSGIDQILQESRERGEKKLEKKTQKHSLTHHRWRRRKKKVGSNLKWKRKKNTKEKSFSHCKENEEKEFSHWGSRKTAQKRKIFLFSVLWWAKRFSYSIFLASVSPLFTSYIFISSGWSFFFSLRSARDSLPLARRHNSARCEKKEKKIMLRCASLSSRYVYMFSSYIVKYYRKL